jgi:uncharacterized membrane protein
MPPEQQTQNYPNNTITPPIESPTQNQPPLHKWRRRLVWCLNIVPPILFVSLIGWLSYEQSQGVSGTEFIAIVVAPVFGLLFLLALVIDIILLIRYLKRSRQSQTNNSRRRLLAWVALAIILLIISGSIISIVLSSRESKQVSKQAYLDDGSEFKSNYQLAQNAGYGFKFFLPGYLPQGYSYLYGQVTYGLMPKDVGFDVHYQNPGYTTATYDFELNMFKTPTTYNPPSNCAYPFSPPRDDDPDTLGSFPCSQIATSNNDSPIYYALVEKNIGYLPPTDIYYTSRENTFIALSITRDSGSINKAEALKIINSLQQTTLDDVINRNIKADKYN